MKIAEKSQFNPDRQKIARILERYDLELKSYREASAGIENTTLIIDTNKGAFVMRIYRQQKKPALEINRELDFMTYLRINGMKVPVVVANKAGDQLTTERFKNKRWRIIVMEFIEGYHAEKYTDGLINELSSIQARMHNLSSTYKDSYPISEPLTRLKESYFITLIPQSQIIDDRLGAFLDRAKDYELKLPRELPRGLCHLDYDTDNTLVKDDAVAAVLDFDDLGLAPFVVCLGYTLWHVYTYAGQEASKSYLENYKTKRKLSDLELSYIKPIMLFRHYVISAVKILNGHTSPAEVSAFLEQEAQLR